MVRYFFDIFLGFFLFFFIWFLVIPYAYSEEFECPQGMSFDPEFGICIQVFKHESDCPDFAPYLNERGHCSNHKDK